MRMTHGRTRLRSLAVTVTLVAACGEQSTTGPGPARPDPEARTASVIADSAALASFLQLEGGTVIGFDGAGSAARAEGLAIAPPLLTLEATVSPPVIGGQVLQATDVAFGESSGNERLAYVTYSMRGEPTLGAVDVIQVSSRKNPKLLQRVTFTDTDVQAVAVAGNTLYLGTSSADERFAERAVLEVVPLTGQGELPSPYASNRLQLPSFVATSVHVQRGKVWVTSGTGGPNTGGLSIFDAATLARVGGAVLDDARGVSGETTAGVVVVTQGTPGRTVLYNHDSNQQAGAVLATGGATIPESRGDVTVDAGWAFIAAGDGGTRVVRTGTSGGSIRGTGIERPGVPGVPAELATVNGLAVAPDGSNAWLFTANGEAGIFAYQSNHRAIATSATPSLTQLGRLAFPAAISANFVRADRDGQWLFVASGLGGLRIIEFRD